MKDQQEIREQWKSCKQKTWYSIDKLPEIPPFMFQFGPSDELIKISASCFSKMITYINVLKSMTIYLDAEYLRIIETANSEQLKKLKDFLDVETIPTD